MTCKNIRHKTMPLCKFISFRERLRLDCSNMDYGSNDNPINTNYLFGQLRHATDVFDDHFCIDVLRAVNV
jgi:hypothetical protein